MKIDWNEAPEGAEWARKTTAGVDWYRRNSGLWVYWTSNGWTQAFATSERDCEPRPAWTGEGLPPVGTVCELWYSCGEWAPCIVMAHDVSMGIPIAVVRHGDQCYTGSSHKTLRPIRTPEQIEAEEREEAVQQMMDDTSVLSGIHANRKILCEELYTAGYRKQVKP